MRRFRLREWRGRFQPPGHYQRDAAAVSAARLFEYGPDGVRTDRPVAAAELRGFAPAAPDTVRWIALDRLVPTDIAEAALDRVRATALEREDLFGLGDLTRLVVRERFEGSEGDVPRATCGLLARLPAVDPEDTDRPLWILAAMQYGRTVVTLTDHEPAWIDGLRQRARRGAGRIRAGGADYLLYLLADTAIDAASAVPPLLHERAEELEERIFRGGGDATVLRAIHDLRRDAVELGRIIRPLAGDVAALLADSDPGAPVATGAPMRPYFDDLSDHLRVLLDSLDAQRDHVASLVGVHSAIAGTTMNQVMKTLTAIATVFIPLTFVAGVYGMNFVHMPGLAWRWGFAVSIGVMVAIAGVMIWWFRRKRWW